MPSRFVIFYSWQSDLPNAANRGFIERALAQAIAGSMRGNEMDLEPAIDRDTMGVPGAPDIAATIFDKIDSADAFVADVSIISRSDAGRPAPNPNVLIELGYALKSLGWERIILVFNDAFGAIEQLPFDLQRKRVTAYTTHADGEDRATDRKALASKLRLQIESVYHHHRVYHQSAIHNEVVERIGGGLIDFLIYASEVDERCLKPWITQARTRLDAEKDALRRFAATPAANSVGIADQLEELATRLELAAHHRGAVGPTNWAEYKRKVADAEEIAQQLFNLLIGGRPLSPRATTQVRDALQTNFNQLEGLAKRTLTALEAHQWGFVPQAQREATQIGANLLNLSYYNIDQIALGLSAKLRDLGRELHLLEISRQYGDGGASSRDVFQRLLGVIPAARQLRGLVT